MNTTKIERMLAGIALMLVGIALVIAGLSVPPGQWAGIPFVLGGYYLVMRAGRT